MKLHVHFDSKNGEKLDNQKMWLDLAKMNYIPK